VVHHFNTEVGVMQAGAGHVHEVAEPTRKRMGQPTHHHDESELRHAR